MTHLCLGANVEVETNKMSGLARSVPTLTLILDKLCRFLPSDGNTLEFGGKIPEFPTPLDVSVSPETASNQSSGSRAGMPLHPWKHRRPSMSGLEDA